MASGTKDLYKTLGVDKGASGDEIKKAYRKLARKHHPDLNPGDKSAEKKFKEINEAYEILSDSKKRQEYDQFGKAAFDGSHGFEGFSGGQNAGFGFNGNEDIFADLFGSFGHGSRTVRGADLSTSLDIDLEDAYRGATKSIRLTREKTCDKCGGTGAETSQTCSTCRGSGSVRQSRGVFRMSQPCPSCGGSGSVTTRACNACRGKGSTVSADTIKVRIPPGADTGSRLRLRGMGSAGAAGGPSGDLLIELRVRHHKTFRREGPDIFVDVPVTISEAVLGARIRVPTLDGDVTMTLPAGTDSGKKFKLRGKGIPRKGRQDAGDQYAVIKIVVPKNVTDSTKEALETLARAYK